jgi:hypothetical protein
MTSIPSQVLQGAPFPLMILALLFVNMGNTEWMERLIASLPDKVRLRAVKILRSMQSRQPGALGTPFERQ